MPTDPLPDMEQHFLYGKCPECGQRFWTGLFRFVAYSMHYATTHLGIRVFRSLGEQPDDGETPT